jgi:hypothetical protein
MSASWLPYFFGELEKLGVVLNTEERRRQALQFAGLGAAAAPAVSGIKNLVAHGKISPWATKARWLPAQIIGGALAGGALPAIQHALARTNIESAKSREMGQRAMELAHPSEMAAATTPGATPEVPKVASMSGQDLRLPIMGGVKPPTQDSKAFANKQLSMSSAEVGPVQPSSKGAKIKDIIGEYKDPMKVGASKKTAPYQQTRKGKRPIRVHNLVKKAGDTMDPIVTDPLVQYLKKQAAKDGQLEDNESAVPTGKSEKELSTEPPEPTPEMVAKVKSEVHKTTKDSFDTTKGVRPKHTEKDHPHDPGVVDRVLGL